MSTNLWFFAILWSVLTNTHIIVNFFSIKLRSLRSYPRYLARLQIMSLTGTSHTIIIATLGRTVPTIMAVISPYMFLLGVLFLNLKYWYCSIDFMDSWISLRYPCLHHFLFMDMNSPNWLFLFNRLSCLAFLGSRERECLHEFDGFHDNNSWFCYE